MTAAILLALLTADLDPDAPTLHIGEIRTLEECKTACEKSARFAAPPARFGVWVTDVLPKSPIGRVTGPQLNGVIVSRVDRQAVRDLDQYAEQLSKLTPGEPVEVELYGLDKRAGRYVWIKKTADVTPETNAVAYPKAVSLRRDPVTALDIYQHPDDTDDTGIGLWVGRQGGTVVVVLRYRFVTDGVFFEEQLTVSSPTDKYETSLDTDDVTSDFHSLKGYHRGSETVGKELYPAVLGLIEEGGVIRVHSHSNTYVDIEATQADRDRMQVMLDTAKVMGWTAE